MISPHSQSNSDNLIQSFWREYLLATHQDLKKPVYDVFHFGDNQSDANELATLVLKGQKCATASLAWGYEAEDKLFPQPNDLSIVTNWAGKALCVIKTSAVEVKAFKDVDADFAAAEGEGDRSLVYWKTAHWAFFGRMCEALGKVRSPEMLVVCERFRVVSP